MKKVTRKKPANPGFAATMQQLRSSNASGVHADQRRDPKAVRRQNRLEERRGNA
jgi:hypothetical protein